MLLTFTHDNLTWHPATSAELKYREYLESFARILKYFSALMTPRKFEYFESNQIFVATLSAITIAISITSLAAIEFLKEV